MREKFKDLKEGERRRLGEREGNSLLLLLLLTSLSLLVDAHVGNKIQ